MSSCRCVGGALAACIEGHRVSRLLCHSAQVSCTSVARLQLLLPSTRIHNRRRDRGAGLFSASSRHQLLYTTYHLHAWVVRHAHNSNGSPRPYGKLQMVQSNARPAGCCAVGQF